MPSRMDALRAKARWVWDALGIFGGAWMLADMLRTLWGAYHPDRVERVLLSGILVTWALVIVCDAVRQRLERSIEEMDRQAMYKRGTDAD